MAQAGVASRRKAETMIREGRVSVNGKIVLRPGFLVDADKDSIKVDGRLLHSHPPHVYFLLNKPRGVVTSMEDPHGRPTVMDLMKGTKTRVFPVGRLDYQTEGLLLLTNDGELAHKLLHPRYALGRVYRVQVKGIPTRETLDKLRGGAHLEPGKRARVQVRFDRALKANAWLEITLREGRHREVRRICEAIGHPALVLKRIRFGPLSLRGIPTGRHRHLTEAEIRELRGVIRGRTDNPRNPKNP
jgi:23S rRNA pseudouridine2605 synthase/16S rRNA pseudouridine516 synthase